MDEPTAWLYQAMSDRLAAERFMPDEVGTSRCHTIAKCQQTVEKAVKSLVAALHAAGILPTSFRTKHEVEPYLVLLLRLPRAVNNREIQQILHGALDQKTRAGMTALDGLAPRMPSRRNTEYPFQDKRGRWTHPSAEGVFTKEEVARFRQVAYRVLDCAEQVISIIRRGPG